MGQQRKPRVLFVGAFPPEGKNIFGGNVTECRILLQSSFSKRLNLDLIDSTQISNPPPGFFIRLKFAIKRFVTFIQRVESQKPDSILLFCSTGASLVEKGAMAWYGQMRGVPALISPRGGTLIDACLSSRFTAWWVKIALHGAKKFLCQGSVWQKFAVDVCGFKKEDAVVITNWTASSELLRYGKIRLDQQSPGPVRLLFVGWVELGKGIFDLVEAARILVHEKKCKISIGIAGDGHARAEVEKSIAAYNLKGYFHMHGWADSSKLQELYASNNVFVLPSYVEGLPNAMIEAMAAGLAVVVTPVGNIPDVIHDEKNGLFVPTGDPEALATAIVRLINQPDLLNKMAASAHITARERFSVESAVDLFVDAIYSTIKR